MPIRPERIAEFEAFKLGIFPEPTEKGNPDVEYVTDFYANLGNLNKLLNPAVAVKDAHIRLTAATLAEHAEKAINAADAMIDRDACAPEKALSDVIQSPNLQGPAHTPAELVRENSYDISIKVQDQQNRQRQLDHAINLHLAQICLRYWDKHLSGGLLLKYLFETRPFMQQAQDPKTVLSAKGVETGLSRNNQALRNN